jgi:leucyl-tRNA synthetase
MHEAIVRRFISALTVMLSPICPHWCENIWTVIGGSGSVVDAPWPHYVAYDKLVRKQFSFFKEVLKNARQLILKTKVSSPRSAYVYVASTYDEKKVEVLKFLQERYDGRDFPADLLKLMKEFLESSPDLKKETKVLMQFGAFMRDEAKERGPDALAIEITFDQKSLIEVSIIIAKMLNF